MLVACGGGTDSAPLSRAGPFGSLRDLVLFDRPAESGGPFFLDRFEVTRADWAEFARSPAGRAAGVAPVAELAESEEALPQAGVDLRQARALARYRHCRLPRSDEWWYAVGVSRYPWGNAAEKSRANTAELGVFEPLPVGTFESGRRGQGPYDLIGNVAEWTESVPVTWHRRDREPLSGFDTALGRWAQTPALTVWYVPGALLPAPLLVAAGADAVPREVVGADFAAAMEQRPTEWRQGLRRWLTPSEYSSTVGIRLCTTPAELLAAVAADWDEMTVEDRRQWTRFVARGNHRAVLEAAFAASRVDAARRPALLGGGR